MKRFEAAGWDVRGVDGHDTDAVAAAIEEARGSGRPSLIACHTRIGFGIPSMEARRTSIPTPWATPSSRRCAPIWDGRSRPSRSPPTSTTNGGSQGCRAAHGYRQWSDRLKALEPGVRAEFERRQRGALPAGFKEAMASLRETLAAEAPKAATRATSEVVLRTVNEMLPETIGGSADLTPSNKTKTASILPPVGDRLRPSLRPLRHPRARHGGGDERHRAAWRPHPLWRHLPRLLRLCAPRPCASPRSWASASST